MKPRTSDKLFIIKKTVMASSASEAIRKDRTTPVHEVYFDPDFIKRQAEKAGEITGFAR
jgi:hypothetical protein